MSVVGGVRSWIDSNCRSQFPFTYDLVLSLCLFVCMFFRGKVGAWRTPHTNKTTRLILRKKVAFETHSHDNNIMQELVVRNSSWPNPNKPEITIIIPILYSKIYFHRHSCWRHLYSLHYADESQEGRKSSAWLQPYFIGYCRVGVSQSQLFYVVSALQLCLYVSSLFWLIRSLQILRKPAALSLAVLCWFKFYF